MSDFQLKSSHDSDIAQSRHGGYPEHGPKILFLSGGSSLRSLCQYLIRFSHNTIHIITPFDSGGSSANIRSAFGMPAVGDIRNRLIALSDSSSRENSEICMLFSHRMPKTGTPGELLDSLSRMASGEHPLTSRLSGAAGNIITDHLKGFLERIPSGFDLSGASIGNLVLASASLSHNGALETAIHLVSNLIGVRGIVRPVVDKPLHLAVRLENGKTIVGQHLMTGKENLPITSPIREITLCEGAGSPLPVNVSIKENVRNLIGSADLVVYPMGSFYSSLIANLLPYGVGDAISRLSCPKIYIPNTFPDPETVGLSLADQVEMLLSFLKKDNPCGITTQQVLHAIVVDRDDVDYPDGIDEKRIRRMGVEIIDYPLVTLRSVPFVDETQLVPLLLSLA